MSKLKKEDFIDGNLLLTSLPDYMLKVLQKYGVEQSFKSCRFGQTVTDTYVFRTTSNNLRKHFNIPSAASTSVSLYKLNRGEIEEVEKLWNVWGIKVKKIINLSKLISALNKYNNDRREEKELQRL